MTMTSDQHILSMEETEEKIDGLYKASTEDENAQKITDLACELMNDSQVYKQNRMNRIALFERLYNNELPRKERQLFNICLPIFGGFEDALQANLTDPVKLQFQETNPEDYLVMPKIQAQWNAEKDGLLPHQMWNSKARDLMHDGLLSGRSIAKIYAENSPIYRNILETTNYSDFHCQPLGGGYLENHLFTGEEGIYMTVEDIESNDSFPRAQRDKIKAFKAGTDEFWQNIEETYGTRFARFKSMYLNTQSNTFAGAKTVYLAQFVVTHKGVRWYVLFDPITKIWLQCEPLLDFTGTDLYPWKSAATHQDAKNFWSKGFSDDIFAVALTVSTLLNQELTNREKSNFNARAYDPTMFTDEAKLDAAQYIPDRLVPADTMGGTKKIAEGIYSFETAQLSGTIDLVQWMQTNISGQVGLSDLSQPSGRKGGQGKQNASIVMAQQQQLSKRLGFRAAPFQEMFGQIGEAYVQGLKEFMPGSLKVKTIGEDGFAEESELKRIEMSRTATIGVKVISTSAEDADNQTKKNARIQALGMLAQDPNLSSVWRTESTLKDVGGYTDEEVKIAMDTQSKNARKQIANASLAIQELLKGKMPKPYYAAETTFLEYIQDFVLENENKVMKRKIHPKHGVEVYLIALFNEYMQQMAPICQKNDQRAVQNAHRQASPNPQTAGKDSGATQPGGKPMPGMPAPMMQ